MRNPKQAPLVMVIEQRESEDAVLRPVVVSLESMGFWQRIIRGFRKPWRRKAVDDSFEASLSTLASIDVALEASSDVVQTLLGARRSVTSDGAGSPINIVLTPSRELLRNAYHSEATGVQV